MKPVDIDALFLGPKSENRDFFKKTLDFMMDEHIHWRRNFHPDDKDAITPENMRQDRFISTLDRTQEVLDELSDKLKASSLPWHSPRYLGHMNSDVLMVATLAYMGTMLYNPNNVAGEASPATTVMELEAGQQMGKLMGFDPDKVWGHITSGGHIANFEALWFMRELKSFPFGVKAVAPELLGNQSDWELLNLTPKQIFQLIDQTKDKGVFLEARKHSVRYTGMEADKLGQLIVPQSRHYCWDKAVDVLGLGLDNMTKIQVTSAFRMDTGHLREVVFDLMDKKIPILGVVAVVGTTEEGAVDGIHEILKICEEVKSQGMSFYFHVDAAYGGYNRSMFLDENDQFMSYSEMKGVLHEEKIVHRDLDWPPEHVYEAYKAMSKADSIVVDPHKMGYTPYSSGMIVAQDKRITDLISYFAPYVWTKGDETGEGMLLGSYIMEGSKPGAAAAAVWAAHKTIPLNINGYGRLNGRSVEAANRFYESLHTQEPFVADNGKTYEVYTLLRPDFNLVNFVFNEQGNKDLSKLNTLTNAIYDRCSYVDGPVYSDSFLTSHTRFTPEDYGNAPIDLLTQLGISIDDYQSTGAIWVLRACVLTPFLSHNTSYIEYYQQFLRTMMKVIGEVAD